MSAAPSPHAAKRRTYKLTTPRAPDEHARQKQICDALRIEIAPPGRVSRDGVVWWACDTADYGGEVPGIRIGRGIIAGLQDMFFLWCGRAGFIELKTEMGVLSDAQQSVSSAVLAAGGRVGIARSAAEVLCLLDAWGLPRAHRVNPPF